MFPIRKLEYEVKDNCDEVLSRLKWAVEQIDNPGLRLVLNLPYSSNRDWLGIINQEKKKFILIEPIPWIQFFILQIVIRGQIIDFGKYTKVVVGFKLGFYTFVMAILISGITLFYLYQVIVFPDFVDVTGLVIWLLVFPVIGILLMIRKLNKLESKLDKIFEYGENEP